MHKKMSHPNEIQNTKVKITFEDTLNYRLGSYLRKNMSDTIYDKTPVPYSL